MCASAPVYTTQLQAGLGMIPETLELLRLWQPGMSPSKLADRVVDAGVFSRTTARRARNLAVEMFAPRYLVDNGEPARRLKYLVQHRIASEVLNQLCFLYTARAQRIFTDFVIEAYWPKYSAGASVLGRTDSEQFVRRALDLGRMTVRWSDTTIKRVSGYLLGCSADFGLLSTSSRGDRAIQRFSLRPETTLYFAYDLHCAGIGDQGIVRHPLWAVFGYTPTEVVARLKLLSHDGHLLLQSSGELVQVSWKYPTIDDCLHVLAQR